MPNPNRSSATKPAHARTNFDDRLSAAAAAKQALLERFRARPQPDDPAEIARQAALKAIADARDARAAERKAAKDAEAARLATEQAARRLKNRRPQNRPGLGPRPKRPNARPSGTGNMPLARRGKGNPSVTGNSGRLPVRLCASNLSNSDTP